jgi:hypothetical protein
MGFIDVSNKNFKILITDEGLKSTIENGLLTDIVSFSVWDDNIVYTNEEIEQPVPNNTGNRNSFTSIKLNLRNPLRNG